MFKTICIFGIISLINFNVYSNVNSNQIQHEINNELNDLSLIQENLIKAYKKMQATEEGSDAFAKLFFEAIQKNPKSLEFSFERLQNETDIRIETSIDNKLRIYSWDNIQGGTMRFFDQIVQYKSNSKIKSNLKIAAEDSQSLVSKIYSVKNNKEETIYLTINNAVLSTSLVSQSVFAFKIGKENLESVKIFKTKTQSLSYITCEFDFFSVVDRPERPVELITLKNNILNIPLINEKGTVTNKNLIYKWNGTNFKYEGVK